MLEDDRRNFFPVVFYDGDRGTNIGHVRIYPSLNHKTFQSILSQKIGIPPNQMSIYLVDRKTPKSPYEDRRKILITGRVSFALIAREKDCAILVVLKRSRRDRRRNSNNFYQAPEKINLLRRNQPEFGSPYYNQFGPPDYELLQIQRENYLAMISDHSNLDYYPRVEDRCVVSETPALVYCEECMIGRAQGEPVEFHCCVNDAVAVAFRSSAGPISRPK